MSNITPISTAIAAKVHGKPVDNLPDGLYIPPDALRIFLETFEGPLDLLLYLIKKQNFDIVDLPIAEITRQYMQYIELMNDLQIGLAAEYLVMAAMLAEIKSRLLLPRPPVSEDGDEDPRAELIRRLQEYECFQKAAHELDQLDRLERDIYLAQVEMPALEVRKELPMISLEELGLALQQVLERAKLYTHHQITFDVLSVRERMTNILSNLSKDQFIEFTSFFRAEEGRPGVVVTLIAILELAREATIEFVQSQLFAPIYLKIKG